MGDVGKMSEAKKRRTGYDLLHDTSPPASPRIKREYSLAPSSTVTSGGKDVSVSRASRDLSMHQSELARGMGMARDTAKHSYQKQLWQNKFSSPIPKPSKSKSGEMKSTSKG